MPPTPDDILDQLLVLQAQDGDRASLVALVARWQERLLARARLLCGNQDAAADVLQHALIGIARGLHRLDDPAAFPAWATTIVTRRARDWIRAEQRRRRRECALGPEDAPGASGGGGVAPASIGATGAPAPTSSEDREHERARVREAVDRLPAELRSAVLLHYAHGLPVDAIARSLSIPGGTVKSRLFHARRALRRLLGPEFDTERSQQ